jgi:hypothetical protein
MCYGNPDEILKNLLVARPLKPDPVGHTALDDFEHLCAYSGCNVGEIGPKAHSRAKVAYISGRLPGIERVPTAPA